MTRWPTVTLGEVLDLCLDAAPVDASAEYSIAGVYSFGRGLFKRDPLSGSETTYRTFNRLHDGDIVISQLKAWEGAIAQVTPEFDGWFLSPQFATFRPRPSLALARYVSWFCRRPLLWKELERGSRGMGARRNSVSPKQFLSAAMPLPPIEEQRRVVAQIERLTSAQARSQHLRIRVVSDAAALRRLSSRRAFTALDQSPHSTIADLCTEIIDCLHSNPVYSEEGVPTVRSPDVGWGELMLGSARMTSEAEYQRRTQRGKPRPGDIILVREGGGTGKAGLVNEGERLSLGQRVTLLRPDTTKILPQFLLLQWLSPLVQDDQIGPRLKGSASPHLNIGALKRFRIICPSIEDQQLVVDRLNRQDGQLKATHALTRDAETLTNALVSSSLQALLS